MSGFLLTLGIAIYKHFHNKEVIIKQFKNKEGLTVKNFFNFIFMRSQFFFKKEKKNQSQGYILSFFINEECTLP